MFICYKLRRAIAAYICGDFSALGGVGAQFNFIGIILDIAIRGNPFVSHRHDELLSDRLSSFVRVRTSRFDYFNLRIVEQFDLIRPTTQTFASHAIPRMPRPAVNDSARLPTAISERRRRTK